MQENKLTTCNDSRKCFGKRTEYAGLCKCTVLSETYERDGDCPFCKPHRTITNGEVYPYNKYYGKIEPLKAKKVQR